MLHSSATLRAALREGEAQLAAKNKELELMRKRLAALAQRARDQLAPWVAAPAPKYTYLNAVMFAYVADFPYPSFLVWNKFARETRKLLGLEPRWIWTRTQRCRSEPIYFSLFG